MVVVEEEELEELVVVVVDDDDEDEEEDEAFFSLSFGSRAERGTGTPAAAVTTLRGVGSKSVYWLISLTSSADTPFVLE